MENHGWREVDSWHESERWAMEQCHEEPSCQSISRGAPRDSREQLQGADLRASPQAAASNSWIEAAEHWADDDGGREVDSWGGSQSWLAAQTQGEPGGGDQLRLLPEAWKSELTCSICQELFVRPVMLQCSHTFCESCITHPTVLRERRCPLCRRPQVAGPIQIIF